MQSIGSRCLKKTGKKGWTRIYRYCGIGHMFIIVKIIMCIIVNFLLTMIQKRLLYINQYTCYRQHNSDDRKINHPRISKQRTEGSSAVPAGTQQAQAPDPSQQQQPEQPVPSQGHESAVIAEIIGKIGQRGIYPAQQPVFSPGRQA